MHLLYTNNIKCISYYRLRNFVNTISPVNPGFNMGTSYSLRVVYFYRNISKKCLYNLYVFDIVYLVGTINEYTGPRTCPDASCWRLLHLDNASSLKVEQGRVL